MTSCRTPFWRQCKSMHVWCYFTCIIMNKLSKEAYKITLKVWKTLNPFPILLSSIFESRCISVYIWNTMLQFLGHGIWIWKWYSTPSDFIQNERVKYARYQLFFYRGLAVFPPFTIVIVNPLHFQSVCNFTLPSI